MKRFLLSALVALGVVSASAQSYLVDNPANRAYFGIRVGGEVTCPGKITGGPVGIKFFNNGGGVEFGGIYNILGGFVSGRYCTGWSLSPQVRYACPCYGRLSL